MERATDGRRKQEADSKMIMKTCRKIDCDRHSLVTKQFLFAEKKQKKNQRKKPNRQTENKKNNKETPCGFCGRGERDGDGERGRQQ